MRQTDTLVCCLFAIHRNYELLGRALKKQTFVSYLYHLILFRDHQANNLGLRRDLEMWFIWCQACRHGGHAQHILEWFHKDGQVDCPVSDCQCKCAYRITQ